MDSNKANSFYALTRTLLKYINEPEAILFLDMLATAQKILNNLPDGLPTKFYDNELDIQLSDMYKSRIKNEPAN